MSNERTDEFLSWRGRLDNPDALPEQGLDNHEASWQRLAERLREKPRRRLTGYWVAAACLLLALIPTIRFFHPRPPATALRAPARQHTLVQKVAAKPLPVTNPVTPPSVIPRTELPLLSSDVPSNVLSPGAFPVVNHPRPPSPRPAPDLITGPTALPAITAPDIKLASDSHQLMAILPTGLPLLVSAAPSRVLSQKQLKVVYYNEISNPSGPSPSTAARIPAFLKFSIGRSGSPVDGGAPVEQPDNDPVLTIKLIPQNH
jgi:hypothetical protein